MKQNGIYCRQTAEPSDRNMMAHHIQDIMMPGMIKIECRKNCSLSDHNDV